MVDGETSLAGAIVRAVRFLRFWPECGAHVAPLVDAARRLV
jgi:hypothetical protein